MNGRIPKRFLAAKLDTLDPAQFSMVLNYSYDSNKGLFLSGPPGVGKTWAIAALTRHLSVNYVFLTAPDLFDVYQAMEPRFSTYHGEEWSSVLENVPLLNINDLGKEYRAGKMGEQVAYKLGRLLRARSEKQLVTHITTNIPITGSGDEIETIDSVYGSSIMSLLREMVVAYEVDGPDRRSI